MSVVIRLRRTGKRNAACHRIVVTDSRNPRDGSFIENIGMYDPRHKVEKIDLARVAYWIPRGAQPSETVAAIIKRAQMGKPLGTDTANAPASPEPAPVSPEPAPVSLEPAPASPESVDSDAAAQEEKAE